MLRIGFLPSDFNPMVLILGEAEDLHLFAGVLRRFTRDQAEVRLDQLGFCGPCAIRLTLSASSGNTGVAPTQGTDFLWHLTPEQAGGFAEQVDQLASPGRVAGSETLDCTTEEAITVKVSRGEYTDDFLLGHAA
jgi:hypothetical protein